MSSSYFWFPPKSAYIEDVLESDNDSVFLTGPTGCGKSELLRRLSDDYSGYIQKNLRGEDTVEDFVGRMKADDGTTRFEYGVLPKAMRQGKNLILDEVDACSPDILFTLQSVLNGYELNITRNAGEIVKPQSGFHICGTANTKGRGDQSGLYQGTKIMNEAFLDRWDIVMELDYPPKIYEIKIITERTDISEELAEKIVETANKIRKLFKEGEIFSTISVRKNINFAGKIDSYGLIRSFRYTIFQRLEPSDQQVYQEIYQRIMSPKFGSLLS
jgi:cobaltochelatase CobS